MQINPKQAETAKQKLLFKIIPYAPTQQNNTEIFIGILNDTDEVIHGVEVKLINLMLSDGKKMKIEENLFLYNNIVNSISTSINPKDTKLFIVAKIELNGNKSVLKSGKEIFHGGGDLPTDDTYMITLVLSSEKTSAVRGEFILRLKGMVEEDGKLGLKIFFNCVKGPATICPSVNISP